MRSMKSFKKILMIAALALLVALSATLAACNKSVTLSFESNGGAPQPTISANKGDSVTLPELSYRVENGQGYVFEGWCTSSDLSGEAYRGTISAPSKSTTYYAKWEKGYRLSLNAGVGRLPHSLTYVKAGVKLSELLAQSYVPTTPAGITFVEWQLNGEKLPDDFVMPEEAVSLVAVYKARYTISYYMQQRDSEYVEDAQKRVELENFVGTLVAANDIPDIEGYLFNGAQSTTRLTLSGDSQANALKVYYDLLGNHVTFHANPPAGTRAEGEMKDYILPEGEQGEVPDCKFTLAGYRFVGWALSSGASTARYRAGDTFRLNVNQNFYAVWEQGYEDFMGGSDYIFLSDSEPNAVYLQRASLGERKGEYNAATGEFSFKDGGTEMLAGKLEDDQTFGRYFYYYNKNLMKEFSSVSGSDKLTIKAKYAAEYKDAAGTHSGTVSVDLQWGYYVFRASDLEIKFIFEEDAQGEMKFHVQDMDEVGYYATASGYPVVYLDGLGNFTYYFDPEHPTYTDVEGLPLLTAYGTYVKNANGYYECEMFADMGNSPRKLESFLFRVTNGAPQAVEGYELKDKAIERSALYGDLDPVNHSLYLDGFSGGTYTEGGVEHTGTFEIIRNWWMSLDGQSAMLTWLINFKYEGATEDIFFALTQDNYGVVTAQLFGKVSKGADGGLYNFDGAITIGGETYSEAFIMMLLDAPGETMLLVKIEDRELTSGERVEVFAPMYTGSVERRTGGYVFGDDHGNRMNFELVAQSGGKIARFVAGESGSTDDVHISGDSGEVTVHPATSTATYVDKQGTTHDGVQYSHSISDILEFYTFEVSDALKLYFYRYAAEDGGQNEDKTFHETYADKMFDYTYQTERLANAFPLRLLLADGGKAYAAMPMQVGEPTYVGEGEYSETDGLLKYTNRHWSGDLLDRLGGDGFESNEELFKEYYSEFIFKTTPGENGGIGKFEARIEDMYFDLDNFKADGYSNKAAYTPDGSALPVQGTFYRMEIVIVFTTDGTNRTYYLKQVENSMKNVSADAGQYYFYEAGDIFFETFGPNYGGEYSDYIVFDGEDRATIVNFENGYLPNARQGSMKKSQDWSESFREYIITEDETGEVYRVLLGTFENTWHEEILIYDLYSDAFSGDWYTEDGGVLHGDGYRTHDATYDADSDGIIDLTGTMVRVTFDKNDIQTHAYTEDEDGDAIVFTYNVTEERTASLVFNIVTANNGIGMDYLVERKLIFGAFAFWEAGVRPGEYIYLDGMGGAELYDSDGVLLSTGTYDTAPEIDEVSYFYRDSSDASANFYFAIYIESVEGGGSYFEYRKFNGDVDGEYETEDDWSHLSVGFYGEIVYTDEYGVVYEGFYSVDGNRITLITHDESGIIFTFYFHKASGIFQFIEQGRLTEDGELPE